MTLYTIVKPTLELQGQNLQKVPTHVVIVQVCGLRGKPAMNIVNSYTQRIRDPNLVSHIHFFLVFHAHFAHMLLSHKFHNQSHYCPDSD